MEKTELLASEIIRLMVLVETHRDSFTSESSTVRHYQGELTELYNKLDKIANEKLGII